MHHKNLWKIITNWYSSHSKQLINNFKWIVLIISLFLIIRFINLEEIISNLSDLSIPIFLFYIGGLLISKIFYASRWKLINRSLIPNNHIPISCFFTTNLLAEFVNIALPSSISGEITRFLKINRHNQNAMMTTTGIFIDRIIGISTMVIVSMVVIFLMDQPIILKIDELIPPNYMLPIVGVIILFGILIIYFFLRRFKKSSYPEKIKNAWKLAKQNYKSLISAIFISIASHLIFSLSHVVLFQRLFPIPILSVISIILAPQLARSIPISILGISGGEGLMVVSQMIVGLPKNTALAITFISLLARYFFAFCGFLYEFFNDGIKFIKNFKIKDETN